MRPLKKYYKPDVQFVVLFLFSKPTKLTFNKVVKGLADSWTAHIRIAKFRGR